MNLFIEGNNKIKPILERLIIYDFDLFLLNFFYNTFFFFSLSNAILVFLCWEITQTKIPLLNEPNSLETSSLIPQQTQPKRVALSLQHNMD